MCLAIPGKIININRKDPANILGKVDFSGTVREINLSAVPEADIGSYVAVHAGFALNVIDEEEAQKTLDCFKEIGNYLEHG
ncbi:MAG TPA: HypC/HybG/HupF family hydrogenase formation chaperone [Spirochaetota bacterium]|nr:HypC/HybG/HupF family hydrogenase formation chaperone [Spirochaetota bacterium]